MVVKSGVPMIKLSLDRNLLIHITGQVYGMEKHRKKIVDVELMQDLVELILTNEKSLLKAVKNDMSSL